jgi:hypothetical protein
MGDTMTKTLYDYTYTDPSGYSYKGQVVADTTMSQYNYQSGQSYQSPYHDSKGQYGTYIISGSGTPTNAPSGAVYCTSYTSSSGASYDSYHYDPASANYYDINTTGYDKSTGYVTGTQSTPAWSGIGLGNEYSYVNTGSMSSPSYHTYGGGGTASYSSSASYATPTLYDYQFLYPDGSYYTGTVVDDGTYGYQVGQQIPKGSNGEYTITGKDTSPPPSGALAGYTYTSLYVDDLNGTAYNTSNTMSSSPYYQKPVGYGGLGTEKDYIQSDGSYYQIAYNHEYTSSSTPLTSIPLPT